MASELTASSSRGGWRVGLATTVVAVAGLLAAPQHARAQASEVTCASDGGREVECEMDTRGVVRMSRQLSRAPCVEGRSWGLSRHGIWV